MAVLHAVARLVRGIDEELWFGNFSDEEAEKKAAESVAAMVGRIVGAKPFPIAAQRLAEATRDPECDLNDVIRILERDVALSTRLLRLVNSATFALRTPCTSVRHATSLVGTERLNQLATTAAILDMVDSSSVHASRILEHSSVVGALCRYLGVHLGLPADELFTCGFLHDIGKLMLLETEGKRYVPLLEEVGHEYDSIHLYERELFGFDHALLAGHVLQRWAIPDPVPKVVAWHHHVTRAYDQGPRWASLVSVLRLADLLSYSLTAEKDEAEVERVARSESASYLDISAAQLAAVWDEMRTLQERSSALFRGEEPPEVAAPVSLRPSSRSLSRTPSSRSLRVPLLGSRAPVQRPRLSEASDIAAEALLAAPPPASVRIQDAPDGPKQFPCVVCSGPSFANTCLACHGYVCPEHQHGAEAWCDLCWREFRTESQNWRLRPILSLILGAGIGATVVGGFFTAASGHSKGSMGMLIGPLIGTGIVAGLVAILHRYAQRAWFLKSRPDRSIEGDGVAAEAPNLVSTHTGAMERAATLLDEANASPRSGTMPSRPPEGEAPLVAQTRKFATQGYGVRSPTPMRNALGLSSEVSISERANGDSGWPASLAPPPNHGEPAPLSLQPEASPIASVLPWGNEAGHSLPPMTSMTPTASVPPTGSMVPGASVAPGSTKEAAERGRTLKLLSEHGSSGGRRDDEHGSSPNHEHPENQEPAQSMMPSSSPDIVVQEMFGGVNSFEREGWTAGGMHEPADAHRAESHAPSARPSAGPGSWSNPRASRDAASLRAADGDAPIVTQPPARRSAEPGISLLAPARQGASEHAPKPMRSIGGSLMPASRRGASMVPATQSVAPHASGASIVPAKSETPTIGGLGTRAAREAAARAFLGNGASPADGSQEPATATDVSVTPLEEEPERTTTVSASAPPERISAPPPTRESHRPSTSASAPPASRRSVAPAKFPSIVPDGAPVADPAATAPAAEASFDDEEAPGNAPLESGIVPAESASATASQLVPAHETSEAWRNLLDSTGTSDGW